MPISSSPDVPLAPLLVDEDEAERLKQDSLELQSITLTQRQLCDLELLMNGAFTPLTGFLGRADHDACLDSMRLTDGTFWPLPVNLDLDPDAAEGVAVGERIALRDQEGLMLAVLDVEDRWEADRYREAELVYGTASREHPGVSRLLEQAGSIYVGGTVKGVQLPIHYNFQEMRHTPEELRALFERLGWRRVVGFHTSRPMHRLERELTFSAAKEAQANLLLHPVVGVTMRRDLSYFARVKCYQALLKHYPHGLAALSLLPLAVRGAGPREALLHALIRRNYGCTHFIVGNDHASPPGVEGHRPGAFHESYAAQALVVEHQAELGVTPIECRRLAFDRKAARFVKADAGREAAELEERLDDDVVARRLATGEEIPEWFTYPEVLDTLRLVHPPRPRQGITLFFTGLSGSGKSTLAKIMYGKFIEEGKRPVTLLDGDIVRRHLSSELGFSKQHRDVNVRRIGFVASEITKNGGVAICAPIAPYATTRRGVREMIEQHGAMVEIHVATPLEVCEARDRKGLYAKARKGIIPEFTGISDPYEEPVEPEIRLDTSGISPMQSAQEIFLYLLREGYLDTAEV